MNENGESQKALKNTRTRTRTTQDSQKKLKESIDDQQSSDNQLSNLQYKFDEVWSQLKHYSDGGDLDKRE